MKKLLISIALLSMTFVNAAEENIGKSLESAKQAFIFWHWDTLYIDIDGHLYYCHELQHSIMCPCFDDDDVE